MWYKTFIISILITTAFSCKTQQIYTPEEFEGRKLTFGTQGGFTGATTENYILENGQFFNFDSMRKTTVSLKTIEKKIVDQAFQNFETFGFDKLEMNDPGNMNYYIKLEGGEKDYYLKWGGNREEVPQTLKLYFKNLSQIAKLHQTAAQ